MDFIFQKVNVYREKYAVLAKFYPINDKNKGDARLFADIAQIKRIMQLVECFQQYQASMQ